MTEPAPKRATYEDLYTVPSGMVGEIIAGELVVTPRPSRGHGSAAFDLSGQLAFPFRFGRGGPGGWIFIIEPEIRLGEDIVVPDLAGWRKERFPVREDHNWISATPDWICEILSPGTARLDRITKMSLYRLHAVRHVWLLDPLEKTLEVFGLSEAGAWVTLGLHAENDRVRAEPFHEVEIELANLWLE